MIAHYRLVTYEPDPFSGLRFPLGALVLEGERVQAARVAQLPGAACLGGEGHARLVQSLVQRLESEPSVTAVERGFGPSVALSEPRALPAGVEDAAAWVCRHILPPPLERAPAAKPRGPQLQTRGFAFFRTWGVHRLVKKTFRPAADGGRWLDRRARGLQPITHWVEGRDRLLLMEPVAPDRAQLEDDLAALATRFLAWRSVLPAGEDRPAQLVAYVLAGGHTPQREAAREVLEDKVDWLVDTDDPAARAGLVAEIQAVGRSGAAQGELGE